MSARDPGRRKRTAGLSTSRRRGEVSMQMTASEIIALAVNCRQNGWLLEDLGLDPTVNSAAFEEMLTEVHEQALEVNRQAVARTMAKRQQRYEDGERAQNKC